MEVVRESIELIALGLEGAGVAAIVLAAVYSTVLAGWALVHRADGGEVYRRYRQRLGHGILLGLEFLVAGDIINTVAVEPTWTSVSVLALVVLVRTFLSFTLQVEMTGRWPWQKENWRGWFGAAARLSLRAP